MGPARLLATLFTMVNFRRTPKPRNYLSRFEQRRLLLLVLSLGLVAYLMGKAGDPATWHWLTAMGSPQAAATSADAPPALDQGREDIGGGDADDYFPGVKSEYLGSVRDDTSGKEPEAWFNLFDVLQSTDQTTLDKKSTGPVAYSQLKKQSREFRGRLVTIRGRVGGVVARFPGPESEIDKYYQLAVSPDDHPSWPIIVYCLYLPEGFPTGTDVSARVEITGFFFKRWIYVARDEKKLSAPLLAARTVHWKRPPPVVKKSPPDSRTALLVIGLAAVVGVMVARYVYLRTQPGRPDEDGPPPNFEALGDVAAPSEVGLPLEEPADDQPGTPPK